MPDYPERQVTKSFACTELGGSGSQRQMFEDPAAWCADKAPGQQTPEDALPLDVRQLQNSALPLQVILQRTQKFGCCLASSNQALYFAAWYQVDAPPSAPVLYRGTGCFIREI